MFSCINDFSDGSYPEIFPVMFAPSEVSRADVLTPFIEDIKASNGDIVLHHCLSMCESTSVRVACLYFILSRLVTK
jgi:hypothetical protein